MKVKMKKVLVRLLLFGFVLSSTSNIESSDNFYNGIYLTSMLYGSAEIYGMAKSDLELFDKVPNILLNSIGLYLSAKVFMNKTFNKIEIGFCIIKILPLIYNCFIYLKLIKDFETAVNKNDGSAAGNILSQFSQSQFYKLFRNLLNIHRSFRIYQSINILCSLAGIYTFYKGISN